MFKKYKKIIAIALSLITICFCFTGCGGSAEVLSAEEKLLMEGTLLNPSQNENFKYNVYTTYVEITAYVGSSAEVVIPGELEGKPVLSIIEKCFEYNENITKVTINNSVIRIGGSAFASCTNLKEIVLPNKIKSIPGGLCKDCVSLISFNIPETVVTIGESSFGGCNSITKLIIPRTVTLIGGGAFSGCERLEEVVIQDGGFVENNVLVKVNNVKIDSGAFAWNGALKKIVVPITSNEIAVDAFMSCSEDAMFYGYVPSTLATICADKENKYNFTQIKKDDEIDKLIRLSYTSVAEGVTAPLS